MLFMSLNKMALHVLLCRAHPLDVFCDWIFRIVSVFWDIELNKQNYIGISFFNVLCRYLQRLHIFKKCLILSIFKWSLLWLVSEKAWIYLCNCYIPIQLWCYVNEALICYSHSRGFEVLYRSLSLYCFWHNVIFSVMIILGLFYFFIFCQKGVDSWFLK